MDRNKFSSIAHQNHVYHNPISEQKMKTIIDMLALHPNDRVIDIGAGKCELLIRLHEKYHMHATAIELYEGAIQEAKQRSKGRVNAGSMEYISEDAKAAISQFENSSLQLGICIGSTHALGGYKSTMESLKKCVSKGGYILLGEGYWKKKPSQAYLQALGAEESDLNSHSENVQVAIDRGLIPLWSVVASEDDWDEYEWLYAMSMENYCHTHPEDPDQEAMLKRIRSWKQVYLNDGRDTLGFGLYLFRNE